MTIKLNSIKADLKRETEGDWVAIPEWPGVRLRVRSLRTPAYQMAGDIIRQRHQRKYAGSRVPDDVSARDYGRALADHILLDWEGFDVAYSPEMAMEKLTDPEYRDLMNQTVWAATQIAQDDVEFVDAAAKNSAAPSATS